MTTCVLHPDGSPTRPEWDDDQCRTCWKLAGGVAKAEPAPARKPLPVRGWCLHLGGRTEFRPGCGGWRCRHACEKGHPEAVPGGNCQTCPDHEPE
jgi:hypothetical protein